MHPPYLNLIVVTIALSALFYETSAIVNPDETPNPLDHPDLCGRSSVPRSRICDIDSLLETSDKDVIEGYINAVTTAEIAVFIMTKMDTRFIGLNSKPEAMKRFTTQLHNHWKVGDGNLQNGIVLALSIKDRQVFISTGVGVHDRLTSSVIQTIIGHMKPSLREMKYSEAIQLALLEIDIALSGSGRSEISEKYPERQTRRNYKPGGPGGGPNSGPGTGPSRKSVRGTRALLRKKLLALIGVPALFGLHVYDSLRTSRIRAGQRALNTLIQDIDASPAVITGSAPPALADSREAADLTDGRAVNQSGRMQCKNCGHVFFPSVPSNLKDTHSSTITNLLTHTDTDEENASKLFPRSTTVVCPRCGIEHIMDDEDDGEDFSGDNPRGDPTRDWRHQRRRIWWYLGGHPYRDHGLGFGFGYGSGYGLGHGFGGVGSPFSNSPLERYRKQSEPAAPSGPAIGSTELSGERHVDNSLVSESSRADTLLRLQALRRQHPEVVTQETYDRMTEAVKRGSFEDLRTATRSRLQEVNRSLESLARQHGSTGASGMSFGGGTSSGGGGGEW